MQIVKNVLCSQAQIEPMTTAKSCCLKHSRQKYGGEGRLVHPKYREILQCKSLLSLLFCYKCLYFYRQDSRLSCPKYSNLFVFVSSRMHPEEGLQCSKVKEFVTLCTMNRDLLILSEQQINYQLDRKRKYDPYCVSKRAKMCIV